MNMKNPALPTLCLIILISCSVFAQDKTTQNVLPGPGGGGPSTCSCSDPSSRCTASITCSSGNAICICSDSGCSSFCAAGFAGEFPDGKTLLDRLQTVEESEIGSVLSKALGKTVSFKPYKENFRLDYATQPESHWSILEYLSQNGDLKINNVDYKAWKKLREIITTGKANFCTGNATIGTLVNELSFFAGKKYQIVSGNSNSKVNIDIKGLTVDGVIEALQKHYQLFIQQ